MTDHKYFWISIAYNIAAFSFITYRIYFLYVSSDNLKKMIQTHYNSKGFKIENIHKLSIIERFKYGAPPFNLFRIYSYFFGILFGKIEYTRKVELIDINNNNEITKYVDLEIKSKKLNRLNEFDSFDI